MIQPISNSVNFGGINIGGASYGATKFIAGNINEIQNPKTREAVKEALTGLRDRASEIIPAGKEYGLFFKQKGGLTAGGSSKLEIALRELSAKEETTLLTLSKEIQPKDSIADLIPSYVNDFFAKAAEKMDGIFQNNNTAKAVSQDNIGKSINITI